MTTPSDLLRFCEIYTIPTNFKAGDKVRLVHTHTLHKDYHDQFIGKDLVVMNVTPTGDNNGTQYLAFDGNKRWSGFCGGRFELVAPVNPKKGDYLKCIDETFTGGELIQGGVYCVDSVRPNARDKVVQVKLVGFPLSFRIDRFVAASEADIARANIVSKPVTTISATNNTQPSVPMPTQTQPNYRHNLHGKNGRFAPRVTLPTFASKPKVTLGAPVPQSKIRGNP